MCVCTPSDIFNSFNFELFDDSKRKRRKYLKDLRCCSLCHLKRKAQEELLSFSIRHFTVFSNWFFPKKTWSREKRKRQFQNHTLIFLFIQMSFEIMWSRQSCREHIIYVFICLREKEMNKIYIYTCMTTSGKHFWARFREIFDFDNFHLEFQEKLVFEGMYSYFSHLQDFVSFLGIFLLIRDVFYKSFSETY